MLKKTKREFSGIFAEHMDGFVAHKRALGYDYAEGAYILTRFGAFCQKYFASEEFLSKDMGLRWAERHEEESGAAQLNRISVIREFGKYLNSIGVCAYVIPPNIHMKKTHPQAYIFSDKELAALFRATDGFQYNKQTPLFHLTVPVMFRTVYCCGLRPSEARELLCYNIDLNTGRIKILESKGHKDRIVVMADDVLVLAQKYNKAVACHYPDRAYFFHNVLGNGSYSTVWMQKTFRLLIDKAEISRAGPNRPRTYDLRHTFATRRLQQWLEEGEDIGACISYLSEYMGHKNLSDTAYYIHLLPAFYEQPVNRKFEVKAAILPEVPV